MSMGGDQGYGHRGSGGWKSDNVSEDLRTWFCQISTQERLQVASEMLTKTAELPILVRYT